MKKVLLTSTALVAFAGAASAEVTISGWAEMGINGGTDMETEFFQDIDVEFRMSGETDGGLTFGAGVDLDENGAFSTDDDGGAFVFISGSFGTITMGDTDGALDWALTDMGNIGNPGSIADDETVHLGYNGNWLDGAYDGQIVRYDNTFGDFGVAISLEMDDDGSRDDGYAIGFKYSTDLGGADLALGLGYQEAEIVTLGTIIDYLDTGTGTPTSATGAKVSALGLGATVTLDSGLTAGFTYTDFSIDGTDLDLSHVGIGAGYQFDAVSVHFNYGVFDIDGTELSGWGLSAGYDLGGGASVLAGYGSSDFSDVGGDTVDTWSLGLSMAF
ncbi:porin [Oceanicola sp. D3]|uniref:porin n=1 Tax=Oceanicola sp. D3 TaxID=2587163 RepID=UPI00112432F1|nr:porin [Oceanicola sp. D3]QDC07798.1 porin [Oceanicola sp. D3]